MTSVLGSDAEIEVVGSAPDPKTAWPLIKATSPDVLTLDIEMPGMDGLTFLGHLMRHAPMPVVIVSSLTTRGSENSLNALELGAVDVCCKPTSDLAGGYADVAKSLVSRVKAAKFARPKARSKGDGTPSIEGVSKRALVEQKSTETVIAIGASTGGTEALRLLLSELPADAPGIVIVQHLPGRFVPGFAKRLERASALRVREARDGDRLLIGQALVAPGAVTCASVGTGRSTGWSCHRGRCQQADTVQPWTHCFPPVQRPRQERDGCDVDGNGQGWR